MPQLNDFFQISFESFSTHNLFKTIITLVVLWIIYSLIVLVIKRQVDDIKMAYFARKSISYVFFLLGLIIVFRIWFQGVQSFLTFFGLLSAGLAIALKDIVMDIFSWIYIIIKRPFVLGDRIEVLDTIGDIIDIGILKVSVLEVGNITDSYQTTGRIITLPNSSFLREKLANSNGAFPYIWHEIPVSITFESNWKKAKAQFLKLLETYMEDKMSSIKKNMKLAKKNHMILYKNIAPTLYLTVKDSGVLITLRFLCIPTTRRQVENDLWEEIIKVTEKYKDIEFAYPTFRHIKN